MGLSGEEWVKKGPGSHADGRAASGGTSEHVKLDRASERLSGGAA